MKELESYLKCSPKSPVRRKGKKKKWKRGASLPGSGVLFLNWCCCSCPQVLKTRAGLGARFSTGYKGGRNSMGLQKGLGNKNVPLSPDGGCFCVHCCSANVPGSPEGMRASSCGRSSISHTAVFIPTQLESAGERCRNRFPEQPPSLLVSPCSPNLLSVAWS